MQLGALRRTGSLYNRLGLHNGFCFQVLLLIFRMDFLSVQCTSHTPLISFSLIHFPSQHLLKNTIHEVPGYEIFYNFLFASKAENYQLTECIVV